MRYDLEKLRFLSLAVALAAGLATVSAEAGGRYKDHVYADSYGNLVVQSHAGSKRIVVGAGHMAEQLSDYEAAGSGPAVIYDNEGERGYDSAYETDRGCYRPPVLVKGRSYMYGFDQGEIPLQGGDCR